jgi:hypothetical protein
MALALMLVAAVMADVAVTVPETYATALSRVN